MAALRFVVVLLLAVWAAVSAAAGVFVYLWVRERYGRGGPFPAKDARALLNPMRALLHPAAPTVRAFGLRPGDVALEIGPGPGYFTVEAARTIGAGGRVICLDIQAGMIAALRARLAAEGVTNGRLLVGDATRLPFASHSIDNAFLVTVMGEVPDRPQALAELRRVLKPGGALSVVESLTDCDYQFEDAVADVCRATGFLVAGHERHRLGYLMRFAAPVP